MSQRKYCLKLLNEFGLLGCKPVSVPIEQNVYCKIEPTENDPVISDITQYQRLVGKLIYLTMTRPAISFAVHYLSQFMHKPLQSHFKLALHVLRYLKLSLGKDNIIVKSKNLNFCSYADADWAKSMFLSKSVNGYCVFMRDSLVSWKRKKQNVVARSSVESEYRSMSNATCEIMRIIKIPHDMKVKSVIFIVDLTRIGFAMHNFWRLKGLDVTFGKFGAQGLNADILEGSLLTIF
ncbi:secreted RxLR effector protein 161-like [Rutidosis leptorrhynchoides]|uniref:secreted RxLR effector protein 161-like n=1 Tax=Rutidosis leptorrhynchoides TaxID=125765 RepID=UPI003A99B29F